MIVGTLTSWSNLFVQYTRSEPLDWSQPVRSQSLGLTAFGECAQNQVNAGAGSKTPHGVVKVENSPPSITSSINASELEAGPPPVSPSFPVDCRYAWK